MATPKVTAVETAEESEYYELVSSSFDKKKNELNYTLKLEDDLTVSSGVFINKPFLRRIVGLTKVANASEEKQGQKTFEFITYLFGDDALEQIEEYYVERTEDADVPAEVYGKLIETFFGVVYPKAG